jgi:non-specific serine/threonine protein kinase
LDESLRVAQTLGDQHGIGFALGNLAYLTWCQGKHLEALELFEQAVTHIRASGDALFTGLVLGTLGWYTLLNGDLDRARRYKEESLAILRSLEATEAVGLALLGLAHVVRQEGDAKRLRLLLAESVALLREAGSPGLADWLGFVGQFQVDQANYAFGVRLLGASDESDGPRFGSLRALFYLMPRDERDTHLATARSAMGELAFHDAWAEGTAMAIDQAVAAAMSESETHRAELPRGRSSGGAASPLTRRQHEVALLVAQGLTNRQIADHLVITERTAGAHIEHILDKLSVGSRAQIAVWASERGLLAPRGD